MIEFMVFKGFQIQYRDMLVYIDEMANRHVALWLLRLVAFSLYRRRRVDRMLPLKMSSRVVEVFADDLPIKFSRALINLMIGVEDEVSTGSWNIVRELKRISYEDEFAACSFDWTRLDESFPRFSTNYLACFRRKIGLTLSVRLDRYRFYEWNPSSNVQPNWPSIRVKNDEHPRTHSTPATATAALVIEISPMHSSTLDQWSMQSLVKQ